MSNLLDFVRFHTLKNKNPKIKIKNEEIFISQIGKPKLNTCRRTSCLNGVPYIFPLGVL